MRRVNGRELYLEILEEMRKGKPKPDQEWLARCEQAKKLSTVLRTRIGNKIKQDLLDALYWDSPFLYFVIRNHADFGYQSHPMHPTVHFLIWEKPIYAILSHKRIWPTIHKKIMTLLNSDFTLDFEWAREAIEWVPAKDMRD